MTPQELELARSLLASVQNTTVQGWDILVRGTVISNAIYSYFNAIIVDICSRFLSQFSKRQGE